MNIIWNSRKVAEGLEETGRILGETRSLLKELLDDYHGHSLPESDYDLLAGDWLDKFLHVTYATWQQIQNDSINPENVLIPVAPDLKSFNQATTETGFHQALQSLAHRLTSGNPPKDITFQQSQVQITSGGARWDKKLLTTFLGTSQPALILCYPYTFRCSKKQWLLTLWKWRHWAKWDDFIFPIQVDCTLDQPWRVQRSREQMPVNGFNELVRALLPLLIPTALLEGFSELKKKVLAQRPWRPQVLYTANALSDHLPFKILAMEWRTQGTKILAHQHGGGYGVDQIHVIEDHETRVVDCFYTWGWQRPDRQVKPLSPPYPAIQPDPKGQVLFMACSFPETVYRLHFHPMPGTLETLLDNTERFMSAMPKSPLVSIRLHEGHDRTRFRECFKRSAPWATYDDLSRIAISSYAQSRLVIHNYIGTSVLETLALNIPTVCFYDLDTYRFREEVDPLVNALIAAKVFFTSAEDAANFVASIMDDPQKWWQQPEVQQARLAFTRQCAHFEPNWPTRWENEFRQWIK